MVTTYEVPPQQIEYVVADFLHDLNRRRVNATTFKIVKVLGSSDGLCIYGSLASKPQYDFEEFFEHTSTNFASLHQYKSMSSPAAAVTKSTYTKIVSVDMTNTRKERFSLDFMNAHISSLSNSLFAGSKLLQGKEAEVLEDTMRKVAKSTPTLPNRL